MAKMGNFTKTALTVVVTTAVVAVLGYFLGFAGLFAHTMAEIFWYAGLFGGANLLVLGVVKLFSDPAEEVQGSEETTTKTTRSTTAKTPATAS